MLARSILPSFSSPLRRGATRRHSVAGPILLAILLASVALGQTVPSPEVRALQTNLANANEMVRAEAARRLKGFGAEAAPAIPELTRMLRSDEYLRARSWAALALGAIGPKAEVALPHLVEATSDPEWKVRVAAAWALGNLGAEQHEGLLAAMLSDEKDLVRLNAAFALYKLRPAAPERGPALRKALTDSDASVAEIAALLLAPPRPDHYAEPILREQEARLMTLEQDLGSERQVVVRTVVNYLTQLGRPAIPRLVDEAVGADGDDREWAQFALAQIATGSRAAVPVLTGLLDSEDVLMRSFAAEALGGFGIFAAETKPKLEAAKNDESQAVRTAAANSLVLIDGALP